MDVEIRHLRSFTAVARTNSFSRAAEELQISQPALSRTIKQLEAALDVRLFDRTSRHVGLTAIGRDFRAHAERVLAAFEEALDFAQAERVIRLGFSWLLPDPWAQDTMRLFLKATGATVALIRCTDPFEELSLSNIDVAVDRGTRASPGIADIPLFNEARVAAVSTHSELSATEELAWTDIPRWPLVVNTVSGSTDGASWPEGFRPSSVVECADFDEWLELVAADRGVGVVSAAARHRSPHPGICYLPVIGAPPVRVRLLFRRNRPSALIRQFIDTAIQACLLLRADSGRYVAKSYSQ